MRALAIALNIGGILAACAIVFAVSILVIVAVDRVRRANEDDDVKQPRIPIWLATLFVGAVFAPVIWTTTLAFGYTPDTTIAVWIAPITYIGIVLAFVPRGLIRSR